MSMYPSSLNRRSFCALGLTSVAVAATSTSWISRASLAAPFDSQSSRWAVAAPTLMAPRPDDRREYETFRERFITAEGRVVDTYNGGISHSEGQGWGMLMAATFDDRATFDRLYSWTRRTLRRPTDNLHAWRYQPNTRNPVADMNNATDGDLYIAGALARGARLWARAELAADAAAIGHDILRMLVRRIGNRIVLLPGAYGFERDGIVVNPSYYAFPLMREVASVAASPVWTALEDDGLQLIEEGRFGRWGLPPDWLRIDPRTGALSPAPGWPARFSYDAIRIPLHMAWHRANSPGLNAAFRRYWTGPHPFAPAWVDLHSGSIAPYPAEEGTRAVAQTILRSLTTDRAQQRSEPLPRIAENDHYYSAALIVLSRIALNDQRVTS